MKKALSILMAAILMVSIFAISANAASETPSSNVTYSEDFESFEVGSNKNEEIFQSKKFMWFEATHHDTNIVERNGSKAVEYSIIGDDGYGYSRLGGIGTGDGGNLKNLVNGVFYTVSMDIEILTNNPASEFYIEYKKADWTGVIFMGGNNPVALDDGKSTFDVKYENGHLEFSFYAGATQQGGVAYITLTGKNMEVDDKVYVDNIEIKPYEYDFGFENVATGSVATSAGSAISNVWNGGDSTVVISEADGNKFLDISHASTGGDAWQVVYINNLWNLKSGWTYRLSMDVLENEYIELYLCYPHNTSPNATYSQNGYVGKSDDPHIIGGSFDGTRLTYDFRPDTAVDASFWAQICIVIKHNADMKLQLDNISIAHVHNPGEAARENIVNSTCSAEGSYDSVSYCTECGLEAERKTVTIDKLPHTEAVDAAVDATCSATGLTEGKHCSVCNEVLVAQETTEKLPHTEVVDAAVDATCSATGLTEGKHCSVCNEVIVAQETTEKLPHTEIVDPAVDATCTVSGKTEGKHCSVCNEVLVAQEEIPAGHTWVDATCAAPKTCSVCKATEGEPAEHTYDGDNDKDCNVCGTERELPEVPTDDPADDPTEPVESPWYVKIWEAILAFINKILAFFKK